MSLLNRPSDGIHSVLIVIFKLLLAEKQIKRSRLENLCAPETLGSNEKVRQTLNRWKELGLLEEKEETVMIHQDIRKSERTLQTLKQVARRLALRDENNENFWDAEASRAADLTRSIAWLLAQDAWSAEWTSWDPVQSMIQKQLPGDITLMQNDTRWNGLKSWATFLGFCWTPKFPSSSMIVDPTAAIRDELPEIFRDHTTIEAENFITALAQALPVLDRGKYRNQVEEILREQSGPDAWVPPPKGQLSTSLSRALLRLIESGALKGYLKADALNRITLTGRNRSAGESFSHFTLS